MKKYLSTLCLTSLFITPSFSFAQTNYFCADDSTYHETEAACTAVCSGACQYVADFGTALGTDVVNAWSTPQGFADLSNSVISDAPVVTLDNSKSGIAQISCPGAQNFLEILIHANGNNELDFLNVAVDSDMDDIFDGGMPAGFFNGSDPITGVCSNGVVSCDPGTWENCNWYTFVYDKDTAVITPTLTNPIYLKGCFCFSAACSATPWVESKNIVLESIGTSIVNSLTEGDSRLVVQKAEINDMTIRYYGDDLSSCMVSPDGDVAGNPFNMSLFGAENPENVYQDAAELGLLTQDEVDQQSADSGSLLTLLENSTAMVPASVRECQIVHDATVTSYTLDDIVSKIDGDGAVVKTIYDGKDALEITFGVVGDDYWLSACDLHTWDLGLWVEHPELIESATLVKAVYDDWMQLQLNGTVAWNGPTGTWINTDPSTFPPGDCELKTSWNQTLNVDIKNYFNYGPLDAHIRVAVAGGGEGYMFVRVVVNTLHKFEETFIDGCVLIENDETCRLKEATVIDAHDGTIKVVENYKITGAVPIETCKSFPDTTIEPICRDWWKIDKVFTCTEESTMDLNITRVQEIESTIVPTATGYTFNDVTQQVTYNQDTGEIEYGDAVLQGEFDFDFIHEVAADCTPTCKILKIDQSSQAAAETTTGEVRIDPTSGVVVYKTCIDDACPADPGDTILIPCGCLSEFSEATTIMELIYGSGKDLTCSDGSKYSR